MTHYVAVPQVQMQRLLAALETCLQLVKRERRCKIHVFLMSNCESQPYLPSVILHASSVLLFVCFWKRFDLAKATGDFLGTFFKFIYY